MYHAERLGGALTLAAMKVPADDFERDRRHRQCAFPKSRTTISVSMHSTCGSCWPTETPERVQEVIAVIERETGYKVFNLPRLEEFYVGLRFEA